MNKQLLEKLLLMLIDSREEVQATWTAKGDYQIGDYVILRSYYSGVIYWKYMGKDSDGYIVMHEARRLWYRQAKKWISLSEVALYGIKKDSKVTEPVNITVQDPTVCEIIKCSAEAIKTIDAQPNYQP